MAKKTKKKVAEMIELEINKELEIESPKAEDIETKGLCYIG